jgi:phthalate 4,5-dioxygenase
VGLQPRGAENRTYLGMGEDDINVHDQWACESMGAIQDRTREHLGTTDKVIMAHRRLLLQAMDTVAQGGTPPGIGDPAQSEDPRPRHGGRHRPGAGWQSWWQARERQARGCAWSHPAAGQPRHGFKAGAT